MMIDFDSISRNDDNVPSVIAHESAPSVAAMFRAEVDALIRQADQAQVIDAETAAQATAIGGRIKKLSKAIDARGKEIRKPADDFVKAVRADVASLVDPLNMAEYGVKRKINIYQMEEEKKRIEQENAARDAAQKLRDEIAAKSPPDAQPIFVPELVIPKAKTTARTESGTSYIAKRWTFEVHSHGLIPREYLSTDEKKISMAVRNGVRDIPGVRIYEIAETKIRC